MTEHDRLHDWAIQLAEHGPKAISLIDETPTLSSIINDVQTSNLNSWPETASSNQFKNYPSVQNGNIKKAFINLSKKTQISYEKLPKKSLHCLLPNQRRNLKTKTTAT